MLGIVTFDELVNFLERKGKVYNNDNNDILHVGFVKHYSVMSDSRRQIAVGRLSRWSNIKHV